MALNPDTLGARLLKLRRARGLSQRELAEKLGVSPTAVHQYEHNTYRPHSAVLESLSGFYKVPLEDLLNGAPSKATHARTPAELKALAVFRRSPEKLHEGMIAVLKATARFGAMR